MNSNTRTRTFISYLLLNKKNVLEKLYFAKYKKPELGRWNTNNSTISLEKKIDFANYDNCYTTMR